MRDLIEKMVGDFEKGRLSRRQLTAALAGLVAAGANPVAGASDFKAVGVNHVTLRVPDVHRSTVFYQEVFGMPMRKSAPTVNILSLNPNCFFGIEAAKQKGPAVDHFSLAIQNFNPAGVAAKLEKRGLKPALSKDSLKFEDPDGITVQLNAPDYPGYVPGQ